MPSLNTVKDLGVLINDSLTLQSHINKVSATANQRVNPLMRACVSRDQSTLVCTYCVYVRLILEYNCAVWSPSNLWDIRRVESVFMIFAVFDPSPLTVCINCIFTIIPGGANKTSRTFVWIMQQSNQN